MANDPLLLNTTGIRLVAQQIYSQATQSQKDHEAAWKRMQQHLTSYPSSLQEQLFSLINTHQQRLSKSYAWQIAFANALTSSADAAEQMDADISRQFQAPL